MKNTQINGLGDSLIQFSKFFLSRSKFLAFLFLSLLLHSCGNDDNVFSNPNGTNPDGSNPSTIDLSSNFGNEISRNFLGTIIDVNNSPIENVTVSIGSSTSVTDANGVFIINNAGVNQRFAYVKAQKTGYLPGSRALVPTTGTNKVTIMMLEETVAGTVNSGEQQTVGLPNGASVTLNGDYANSDGTTYTGAVNVILHFLDATDEDTPLQMPGMLYAANANNQERMLQTMGMLAVELRDSAGEELNIAEGSSAEIRIPLDASLVSSAPSTIPLWYFDENKGYWIEDGEATLIGSEYVGTVSHFSFWNCDIPAEAINLCVTVSINEDPVVSFNQGLLANLRVDITSSVYGTRDGYTNENGEVCGLVPRNEILTLEVFSDDCQDTPIFSQSVGPYNSDDTENITIQDEPEIITETITGRFNTCSGNTVTNGYVVLKYNDKPYVDIVTNGLFEINLLRCTEEKSFVIEAFDYDNAQTTGEINYIFNTPFTNLGTLISCNTVSEFIQFTVDDGEEVVFLANLEAVLSIDAQEGNFLYITATNETNNTCFYILGGLTDAPYVGTYGSLENGIGFSLEVCTLDSIGGLGDIIYNLTALGEVGEYIDMNFSGSYLDISGNTHTINGVLHVLRD